jgi:hypothetical protein
LTSNNDAFNAAQESRSAAFQDELAGIKSTAQDGVLQVINDAQNRTTDLIARISELRDEAQATVGAIGEKATTYAYDERAKEEEGEANKWRGWAIAIALCAVVAVAAIFVFDDPADDATSSHVIAKFTISAALIGIASYAARQATLHRRASASARWRALALATLPAYLEQLEPDQAQSLRESLTFVYFVSDPEPTRDSRSNDAMSPAQSALQAALDVFKSAQDRAITTKIDDAAS